jgi:hypothetical protein
LIVVTHEMAEMAVGSALSMVLADQGAQSYPQNLASAAAALLETSVIGDDRWSKFLWIDDILVDRMDRIGRDTVRISGLVIIGDERRQWVEPFLGTLTASQTDRRLAGYRLRFGDASVGFLKVEYDARRPDSWPDTAEWLFDIGPQAEIVSGEAGS